MYRVINKVVHFLICNKRIFSDGDLDGIFGSGLLIKATNDSSLISGFRDVLVFPSPRSLRGLVVSGAVLLELPLSKGLVYEGENVLIDHHPQPARVEFYRGREVIDSFVVGNAGSVARAVYLVFRDVLSLSDLALKILDSIDNIDNANHNSDLDWILHKAFMLNKASDEMRYMIVDFILRDKWEEIIKWAKREAELYDKEVPKKIEELVSKAKTLLPNIAYFTYNTNDKLENAALTPAMIKLEEKYDIVIAISTENSKPQSARIATKNKNLLPIFQQLQKMGLNAGGRSNVGGIQFTTQKTIEEAVEIIKTAIKNTEK